MDTVETRVGRGAAWLDAVRPEWWTEVDLGSLRLSSACNCVLGQIVGETDRIHRPCGCGCDAVEPGYSAVERVTGIDWMVVNGFTISRPGEWAALDEAWIVEIKARWERGL